MAMSFKIERHLKKCHILTPTCVFTLRNYFKCTVQI